jgi:hypothetical protein
MVEAFHDASLVARFVDREAGKAVHQDEASCHDRRDEDDEEAAGVSRCILRLEWERADEVS